MQPELNKRVVVFTVDDQEYLTVSSTLHGTGFATSHVSRLNELGGALQGQDLIAVVVLVKVSPDQAIKLVTYLHASVGQHAFVFIPHGLLEPAVAKSLHDGGMVQQLRNGAGEAKLVATELEQRLNPHRLGYYNVNVINCFSSAASDVVDYYLGEIAELQRPRLKYSRVASNGYASCLVPITLQDIRGSVSLTLDRKFAILLTSRIKSVSRTEASDQPHLLEDVAREVCSQAFSKAVSYLSALGKPFKMGEVQVSIGDSHKIVHLARSPAMLLPFKVGRFNFQLEYCLEQDA